MASPRWEETQIATKHSYNAAYIMEIAIGRKENENQNGAFLMTLAHNGCWLPAPPPNASTPSGAMSSFITSAAVGAKFARQPSYIVL